MSTIDISQAVSSMVNFLLGGTVSATDAAIAIGQVTSTNDQIDKMIGTTSAGADIIGVSSSTVQMLKQFAADSAEAGELFGRLAERASFVGLAAGIGAALKTAYDRKDLTKVTSGQLDAIAASALGLAAFTAASEVAIPLAFLACGMTIIGWETQGDQNSIANALSAIKNVIQPYFSKLSASDQTPFASSLSNSIQSVLSGGVMVPKVDSTGQVTGYAIDIPTTIAPQSDGSTVYTFASGIKLQQGANSIPGPMQTSSTSGASIWTIPQSGTTIPETTGIFQDGSYSVALAEVRMAPSGLAMQFVGGQ
jgi:hypothetical protein